MPCCRCARARARRVCQWPREPRLCAQELRATDEAAFDVLRRLPATFVKSRKGSVSMDGVGTRCQHTHATHIFCQRPHIRTDAWGEVCVRACVSGPCLVFGLRDRGRGWPNKACVPQRGLSFLTLFESSFLPKGHLVLGVWVVWPGGGSARLPPPRSPPPPRPCANPPPPRSLVCVCTRAPRGCAGDYGLPRCAFPPTEGRRRIVPWSPSWRECMRALLHRGIDRRGGAAVRPCGLVCARGVCAPPVLGWGGA